MLGNIKGFFKKFGKKEEVDENTKDAAKERLHLVLMQDRANVSADFLEMMKQEIIDVIKKYVDVDEEEIDVRLTNQINDDGSNGAPALYANIPIKGINNETKGAKIKEAEKKSNKNIKSEIKENVIEKNGNDNKKEAKKVVQDEKKQEINKKVPENEENIVEDQPTEAVDSDADDNENQEDFSEEIEDEDTESSLENEDYPGEDVVEIINLRGETTTVYKLVDGRYMDCTNTVYIYDGKDTWTDTNGVEWNQEVI